MDKQKVEKSLNYAHSRSFNPSSSISKTAKYSRFPPQISHNDQYQQQQNVQNANNRYQQSVFHFMEIIKILFNLKFNLNQAQIMEIHQI